MAVRMARRSFAGYWQRLRRISRRVARWHWRLVLDRQIPSWSISVLSVIPGSVPPPITAASPVSSSQSMDKILVHGGRKLSGTVSISGSKNSALPILAATLLTQEACVIHHVPDLSDVHYMLQILDHLGCAVERASGTVTVKAEKVKTEA